MKTIIVPTDFSDNAMHALRYACMLNAAFNGKIILFHSYAVPLMAGDTTYAFMPADDELKEESDQLLKKHKQKIAAEFPGMNIETVVEEGFAEQAITETAKTRNADLLVMARRGQAD